MLHSKKKEKGRTCS